MRVRVLVVNAGSSSLKLSLLDGDDDGRSPSASWHAPRAQVDAEELRAALDAALGEADAVGHRIVHGGERFRDAVLIDAARRGRAARAERARAAAPAEVAGRARRGQPRRCRTCRRSPASTPPSTRRCRRPPRPTRCRRRGASAGACAATASTASRTPGSRGARRSCCSATAAGLRIVSCHLGAGRVAVRDRRRALGRHDDGLHAARGPRDGDALGQRRPGPAAVAARARAVLRRRELADALEHHSGLLGLAGSADMREILARARCRRGRRAARARRLRAPPARRRSRRWRPRSAGSTRSCSPAASASTRRRFAPRGRGTRRSSAVASQRAQQRRGRRRGHRQPTAEQSVAWSSPRARTSRSHARSGPRRQADAFRRDLSAGGYDGRAAPQLNHGEGAGRW